MSNFKSKYPAFAMLMALTAALAQDFSAPGQTIVQKLVALSGIVPQALAFVPMAGLLSSELAALKAAGAVDMEEGAEVLVTDLAFTSEKAKAIIQSAIPVAERIAGGVADVEALIKAIKA